MMDYGLREIKCSYEETYAWFEVCRDDIAVEFAVYNWDELVLLAYEVLQAAESIYMETKDLCREEAEATDDFRAMDAAIDALEPLMRRIKILRKARWHAAINKLRRANHAKQKV
jgi:ribosome-associated translation inhibitor RaiA